MMPRGGYAVVARRSDPPDSLDYFPTPPWATRAFMEHVLKHRGLYDPADRVLEPACGEGHMASVLREYYPDVIARDVFPYGYGEVGDFLDRMYLHGQNDGSDWIITNPPFKVAEEFVHRALEVAERGVAVLVRTAWLEGEGRYFRLFSQTPPYLVSQYVERVPMHKGRWEPDGGSMTAYCWVVWVRWTGRPRGTAYDWIPPGQRKGLTKATDAERFGARADAPLLDGGSP
jgi:hypothetical protein